MTEALHYRTITELAALIKAKDVSPVEVTTALLERIEALDGRLKSYATVMAEAAMEQAKVAEREIQAGRYRGLLHGVPVAVKDLCFTTGVRTMGGSAVYADHIPTFDSTVVQRYLEQWVRMNNSMGQCSLRLIPTMRRTVSLPILIWRRETPVAGCHSQPIFACFSPWSCSGVIVAFCLMC